MANYGILLNLIDDMMFAEVLEKNKQNYFFFIEETATEREWIEDFIPKKNILIYKVKNKYNSYIERKEYDFIFKHSDIKDRLKEKNIKTLLITTGETKLTKKFCEENGIKVISTCNNKGKRFEDKIYFDKFLTKYNLPKPASFYGKVKSLKDVSLNGKIVVQKRHSSGSEGTYFIDNQKDFEKLVKNKDIDLNQNLLFREFVKGETYGITIFIHEGVIALSILRTQGYYKDRGDKSKKVFAGVQWAGINEIENTVETQHAASLQEDINNTFTKIGEILYQKGLSGFFNFDFIISNGKIYIIECNPRSSMATPYLVRFPEFIGGVNIAELLLGSLRGASKTSDAAIQIPLKTKIPNIQFHGSSLNFTIAKDAMINNIPKLGLYQYDGKSIKFYSSDIRLFGGKRRNALQCVSTNIGLFTFYTNIKKGEKYKANETIAYINSNIKMFENGYLNEDGERIINWFKV